MEFTSKLELRGTSSIWAIRNRWYDDLFKQDPVNLIPQQLNDLDFVNFVGEAIAGLNPDDEQIDVLKDAAATALYGVRAANGIRYHHEKRKVGPPKYRILVDRYAFSISPHYSRIQRVNLMNFRKMNVSRKLMETRLLYRCLQ